MTEASDITRYPSGAILVSGGVDADDADAAGGGSGALHRGSAIGTAGVWMGVSELAAGHVSSAHHHEDQTTIVYLITGAMEFTIYGDDAHAFTAKAGDFVAIPGGVIHAERNPSDEGCLCVVLRTNGEVPTVVNLPDL